MTNVKNTAVLTAFRRLVSNVDMPMNAAICCNPDAIADTTKKNRLNAVVTADNQLILLKNLFIRANETLQQSTLFNVFDLDPYITLNADYNIYYEFPVYVHSGGGGYYPNNRVAGLMYLALNTNGNLYLRSFVQYDYNAHTALPYAQFTPPRAGAVYVIQTLGKQLDLTGGIYYNSFPSE